MTFTDNPIRIVVGTGEFNNNPGWIHTQETELSLLRREDWERQFIAGSIDAILAEHVWEHLTYEEGTYAASVCYEFLREGGYIRCAVPDGYFPDEDYQTLVQIGGPGPSEHPAASHKILHNYRTLTAMFEAAGFHVRLLEYCDESGQFHFRPWDTSAGFIYRSMRFDQRNQGDQLQFVSLIVDAVK